MRSKLGTYKLNPSSSQGICHYISAKSLNNMIKVSKPSMWRLLETIDANQFKLPLKATKLSCRLLHVDILLKITMKERILNIQLMKTPMPKSYNSIEERNNSHFSYMRKSTNVIQTIYLSIASGHHLSLQAINLTI